MANEFYIEPAGNLMQGLSVLGSALENRTAVMKDRAMRQGAIDVIKKGNADEIADYIANNPGSDKVVDSVVGFKNEQTKRNMADTAITALTGPPEKIAQTLLDRADFVKSHGGDYKGTISLAQVAMKDPEQAIPLLERGLALSDPKLYQSYYLSVYGKGNGTDDEKFKSTTSYLTKDANGKYHIEFGTYNNKTNDVSTKAAPLIGIPVDRIGETAQEKFKSEIGKTRTIESIRTGEQATRDINSENIKGSAETEKDTISTGITSAKLIPSFKRSIDLLRKVKTGGLNKALYDAKNWLGVTGADEGELSYNLGKAVVSQLRQTFGAQFTEREGKKLDQIEASFSKNPSVNIRILKQALKRFEIDVNAAKRAAKKRNDPNTIKTIDDYMSLDLDEPKKDSKESSNKNKSIQTKKDLSKHSNEDLLNILNGGK